MKLNAKLTPKVVQINKAQSRIIGIAVAATVIAVFCLTSAKVLFSQALYQRRVINARNTSTGQLNTDISNANKLISLYNNVFIGSNPLNIIGGQNATTQNTTPPDGDNGKIVLDALPTTYDFPALLTSISKMMDTDGVGGQSIGGSDASAQIDNSPSPNPQPVPINLTISGSADYATAEKLIKDLERSIRPFDITHLTLSGSESDLSVSLDLTTYYQQAKSLSITSKEVK